MNILFGNEVLSHVSLWSTNFYIDYDSCAVFCCFGCNGNGLFFDRIEGWDGTDIMDALLRLIVRQTLHPPEPGKFWIN